MDRRLITMTLAVALPLAACDRTPTAATPPAPAPAPTAAAGNAASTLPVEFIVSTNEPFWQARVAAGEVVLDGPDVAGRRFTIDRQDEGDGARVVHASDAAGTLSVTLMPGPCQDSMSGAEFPQAGELIVDGIGPTPGCARPADMPPPAPPEG